MWQIPKFAFYLFVVLWRSLAINVTCTILCHHTPSLVLWSERCCYTLVHLRVAHLRFTIPAFIQCIMLYVGTHLGESIRGNTLHVEKKVATLSHRLLHLAFVKTKVTPYGLWKPAYTGDKPSTAWLILLLYPNVM